MTRVPSPALARSCLGLFGLSTLFPLAASVMSASHAPGWLGPADAAIAAAHCVSSVTLAAPQRTRLTDCDRLGAQTVAGIVPLRLALFFIIGDRIAWHVLVIGLAWRAWLLLQMLPFIVAALREPRPTG